MGRSHNTHISITKGIGIILMVIGHSGSPQLVHDYIYLFHMPLFYMASGYFYKGSHVLHKKKFIAKRIKGLYVPFLKWGFIFILLHNLLGYLQLIDINGEGYHVVYDWKMYLKATRAVLTCAMPESLIGPVWFLEGLFISYLFLLSLDYAVSKIVTEENKRIITNCVIVLIILIATFITTDTCNIIFPRNIDRDLGCISLIYMGYVSAKLNNRLAYKAVPAVFCFLAIAMVARYWGTISVADFTIRNPFIFLSCGYMGWYLIMYVAQIIEKRHDRLCKFLNYIGEHTMTILVFHLLAFKFISLIIVYVYHLPFSSMADFPVITSGNGWWIAYGIAGVALPVAAIYATKHIKLKVIRHK